MFLYFLKDRCGPYRKIGIAVDVERRIGQLPDDIDRANSYVVECFKRSSDVERSLHHLFSDFRISKVHKRDGYTEWFAEDCFDAMQRFIRENQSMLGIGPFVPIPDDAPEPGQTQNHQAAPSAKSVGQRKRRMTFSEYMEDCRESLQGDGNKWALRRTEEFFGAHALLKWPTQNWYEWGVVFNAEPSHADGSELTLSYGPGEVWRGLLKVDAWVSFSTAEGDTHYSCRVSIQNYEWHIAMKDYALAVEHIIDAIPTADACPEGIPYPEPFSKFIARWSAEWIKGSGGVWG